MDSEMLDAPLHAASISSSDLGWRFVAVVAGEKEDIFLVQDLGGFVVDAATCT